MSSVLAQVQNATGQVPLIYIESDLWAIVLWGFIACAVGLCILSVVCAVKKFLTPQESINIYDAKRRKESLILQLGLDHWGEIIPVRRFIPEGVLETKPTGKGALKTNSMFQLPQKTTIAAINVKSGKNAERTRLVAQWLADKNSEKVVLRGARVPIFGAVADKAIAVGLKGFAALSFLDKLERLHVTVDPPRNEEAPEAEPKMSLLEQLKANPEFSELASALEEFKQGFSLIDLNAVRNQFPYFYDQTHRDSMKERNQIIGFRKAAKKNDKSDIKVLLMLLVLVFGLLAAAALILKFL